MTIQTPSPRGNIVELPPRGKPKVVEPLASIALPARERILVYGREGTGKTEGWLSIAERWPESQFFIMDTDDSVQRMLETDHKGLTNVHNTVAQGWKDFDKGIDDSLMQIAQLVGKLKQPIRKEDLPWLVVDFADTTWDMVQNYFTEEVFNTGIEDYFLQARKVQGQRKAGNLQPLDGWTDWQVINKIFQSRWNGITKGGGPFHLYITARAVDPSGDLEAKSLYKTLRKMPGGEKRMGGRVHTVMLTTVDQQGWYLSTAKDRGRPLLDYHKSADFALSYLIKIAGWEL